jgi:molybdate transport system ATP-binding protein
MGDFILLSGHSGSGKTTTLRVLAGIENAKGSIVSNNNVWLNDNFCLKPQKRDIGFVFQDYALFENMSIKQNLLFIKNDKTLASYLLKITNLYNIQNRSVRLISGGEKQRVSLCRALMTKPSLLLLDEPFSAIDLKTKEKMQKHILQLHKEFNLTTMLVSHHLDDGYKMANRLITLKNGEITEKLIDKQKQVINNHLYASSSFAYNENKQLISRY